MSRKTAKDNDEPEGSKTAAEAAVNAAAALVATQAATAEKTAAQAKRFQAAAAEKTARMLAAMGVVAASSPGSSSLVVGMIMRLHRRTWLKTPLPCVRLWRRLSMTMKWWSTWVLCAIIGRRSCL